MYATFTLQYTIVHTLLVRHWSSSPLIYTYFYTSIVAPATKATSQQATKATSQQVSVRKQEPQVWEN